MLQPDGLLAVIGRSDTVINAGGVKLSPETLEEALSRHPLVREVAVLGVRSGSRTLVRAVVVPVAPFPPDDLRSWVAAMSTRLFVDEVRFAESLPRTASMKLAREDLARLWGR